MSDGEPRDGANVEFAPPLVPVIALGVGLILQHLVWTLAVPLVGFTQYAAGGLLLVAGLGLMMGAFGQFQRTGQDPKPWLSTPEVIAVGVYKWTRNPMYLSMGLLQAGVGVLISNGWVVVLVAATWAAIYKIAIQHEEAYLERKFGTSYLAYKESVRRWL
ncbi:MAG: isoprenylcysteine carboxylmethyltransferase family protein [Myxococcota bacterium]|jgi:protein-S-isoprenylcysteine O-methyltransferase Ste14